MPEEKYGSIRRASCSQWRSRLLRWSVLGIGWTTYILYRSFVVGRIKYDPNTGKMIIQPRNMWTQRIALILKISAICADHFGIHYLYLAAFPVVAFTHSKLRSKLIFEYLVESVVFQIAIWNICRLYNWLRSLSWNRSLVDSVNEVIHTMSLVEDTLGPVPLEGTVLLIIYVVQFIVSVLQIVNYLRSNLFILALNALLLVMFYSAYVAYQFLLLAWIASFKRFLESYHQEPTREQRQKLLHLFRLYSRISNRHQDIMVLWLPVASMLFSNIVILVSHWAAVIYCILYIDRMDAVEKWQALLREHLGGSLAPFLRILFIGLCNDRLAQLERFLSLQLLIVDLRYPENPDVWRVGILSREHTCFDLQSRAQPIRNQIMSIHQVCGCPFVLEFLFCALLNALTSVQYGVSNDINLYDEDGVKR